MSISIRFLHQDTREPDIAIGQITLGTFVEEFEMALTTWNRERYELQWREGIQRILNGDPKSCLITSFWGDKNAFGGEWWLIYRVNDDAAIRNQLIRPDVFDQSLDDFNPDNPYPSIPDRHSEIGDEKKPSEWLVPLDQITPLAPLK